jgi:dienelactone hydrolase
VPFLIIAALLAIVPTPVLHDPVPGFAIRKGHLAKVEVQTETRLGSGALTELRLIADTGLAVDLAVRTPAGAPRPRPTILILGGKGTGRDAARLAGETDEVVVAALSYPFAGDPDVKGMRAVLQARRIQRAILDTVPAILLANDYLLGQRYVDPHRFELVGVSLGAFLVGTAGALDRRIRRVWLVHGAGEPATVIEYALHDRIELATVRRVLASALNELVAGRYLAAERWVGRISPRPVVVINARGDESLPPASVAALHAALEQPYEIIWTDGPHVQPNRPEVLERLRARILERVVRNPSGSAIPIERQGVTTRR